MSTDLLKRPWEAYGEPFRIAGNLYYVGTNDVSCHLIDTGDGLILMDTAYPQTVYLVLESIRRLGFDPHDIAWILHSHGHYDHFGGTRAIVELTGAKTFLGVGDLEILTERPELSWAPEYGVEFHETFTVDTALRGGEVLTLGDTSIECVHVPGHTPGSISYFFTVTEDGETCRSGGHGGPGRNTLTDEYLAQYGLPQSRRDDYLRSLERLKQEEVDIFIGIHPDQSDTLGRQAARTDHHNPFIDKTAWPKYLEDLSTRFRECFGDA